tara:strand:- start:7584 stop:7991 length:408 start_codon:yes stop_codon:yes gene_type:complete
MFVIILLLILIILLLSFSETYKNYHTVRIIKIAKTNDEKAKGLMNRKEKLPVKSGMLFVYDFYNKSQFWMKDTYIDLDIIFLDDKKIVVGVLENMKSLDENFKGIDKEFIYAIEMNAGSVECMKIKVGDYISLKF